MLAVHLSGSLIRSSFPLFLGNEMFCSQIAVLDGSDRVTGVGWCYNRSVAKLC